MTYKDDVRITDYSFNFQLLCNNAVVVVVVLREDIQHKMDGHYMKA